MRRTKDGLGGPTRAAAAGPDWRRTSRGLYVPAWVDSDEPDQRVAEAAAILPAYGGVTGWAALAWAGGGYFRDVALTDRPVTLAVMHGEVRAQRGVATTSERLPPRDLGTEDGLAVTTRVRSLCFEMRYAPSDRDATVLLDMACADDLVSIDEVAAYTALLNGWTGVGRCRFAVATADENCWSPMESWLRLFLLIDLGVDVLVCNPPVFDLDHRHVGTPDLLDPVAGLVIEYEGALHLQGRRRAADLQHEAGLRRVGLEYVVATAADLSDPHRWLAPRVEDARARALATSGSRRQWTLDPPAWWRRTGTVAARRVLSSEERQRWLRYRVG